MNSALHPRALWIFCTILLIAGCENGTLVDSDSDVAADVAAMSDSAPAAEHAGILTNGTVMTVASFDASAGQLPEGIAVDEHGNIYLGMSGLGEIWKLAPDGTFEDVVAEFDLNEGDTGVLGLDFDESGNLYVAVSSTNADVNGVWKISPSAMERLHGTGGLLFPNDVIVGHRGEVYITDSAMGAVWRYSGDGPAEVWVQDESLEGTGAFGLGVPIGANGIAVVPGKKLPIARQLSGPSVGGVVVSNSEKGQVVYVPILPDGSAGSPMVMIADENLFGVDGIALDARGAIYGAINVANTIVRISRDGSGFTEVASGEPLDFPAGLTFGSGRGEHTLFIANFAIIHFLSDPPTIEEANPAVLSLHVGPPGRAR